MTNTLSPEELLLFTGQSCIISSDDEFYGDLKGTIEGYIPGANSMIIYLKGRSFTMDPKQIFPLLRCVSTITLDEYKELEQITKQYVSATSLKCHAQRFKWYLKNGFDIFEWIPDGKAFDVYKY